MKNSNLFRILTSIVGCCITVSGHADGLYGKCPLPAVYLNQAGVVTLGFASADPANQPDCLPLTPTPDPAQPPPGGSSNPLGWNFVPRGWMLTGNPGSLAVQEGSGGKSGPQPPLLGKSLAEAKNPGGYTFCSTSYITPVGLTGALQYNATYYVNVPALQVYSDQEGVVTGNQQAVNTNYTNLSNNCNPTTLTFSTGGKLQTAGIQFSPQGLDGAPSVFRLPANYSYSTATSESAVLSWEAPAAIPASGPFAQYQPNPTYFVTITPQVTLNTENFNSMLQGTKHTVAIVSGLSPNTKYTVTVSATDDRVIIPSGTATFRTPPAQIQFAQPAQLKVSATEHKATLSWPAVSGDDLTPITYSLVVRSAKGVLSTQTVTNTSATITGLIPGALHFATVTAVDKNAGNRPSLSLKFRTKILLSAIAKNSVSFRSQSYKNAVLTWKPVTGDKSNRIQYNVSILSPTGTTATASAPLLNASGVSSIISNARPNTPYQFKITAIDKSSINSPSVTVTFPTPKTTLAVSRQPSYSKGIVAWSLKGDYSNNITYNATISPNQNGETVQVNQQAQTATFLNLVPEQQYQVTLTATDAAAKNSPVALNAVSFTAPEQSLSALTGLSVPAETLTDTSAVINWNAVTNTTAEENAVSGATYSVQVVSADDAVLPASDITSPIVTGTTVSSTITNLKIDTAYTVTVTAQDNNAEQSVSGTNTFSTKQTTLTLSASAISVSSATYSAAGAGTATASWDTDATTIGDTTSHVTYSVSISPTTNGETATLNTAANNEQSVLQSALNASANNEQSVTLNNLQPNTPYTLTVTATDARASNSPLSVEQSFTTPKATLTPLSQLTITHRHHHSAVATWENSTGAGNINYNVSISPNSNGEKVKSLTVGSNTSSAELAQLEPGTRYTVTVQATNTNASNTPSASKKFKTKKATLTRPSGLIAASASSNSATLTWNLPDGDYAKNISSAIQIKTSNGVAISGSPFSVSAGNNSLTVTGLQPTTTYTFTVTASDQYAKNSPVISKPAQFTTAQNIVLTQSNVTENNATLAWQGNVTSPTIQVTSNNGGTTLSSKNITINANNNTASITGLQPNTTYQATMVTSSNAPLSNQLSFTTSQVTSSSLTVSIPSPTITATCAKISWQPVTGSNISYSISGVSQYTTPTTTNGAVSSILHGLSQNKEYTIAVKATDDTNDVIASSPHKTFHTQQAPIMKVAYSSDETAKVTWSAPTNMIAGPAVSYVVTATGNATVLRQGNTAQLTNLKPNTEYTVSMVVTPQNFPTQCKFSVQTSFHTR